jgi:hypothetical protein
MSSKKGVLDNPADYRDTVLAPWQENAFVLADNSNIFISAQHQDGGERDPSVRLSLPKQAVRCGWSIKAMRKL